MWPSPKLLPHLSRSRRSWSSQALRNCVTIAVYAVSFLVPARTICRSSRERRAFWRSRYRRISSSKTVRPVCSCRHGASVNVSSSSTISYSAQSRQRSFQRWLDDRVVVLQISRFGSFGTRRRASVISRRARCSLTMQSTGDVIATGETKV